MDFITHDFRLAGEILDNRAEWAELVDVIRGISMADVVTTHLSFVEAADKAGKKRPAGGQKAINALFRERLQPLGWHPEPRLFADDGDKDKAAWAMDFIKSRVGVEVTFNHSEAIPWTLTRLNLAGESAEVVDQSRVEVGVAIYATKAMRNWAKMDSAVGTFERAKSWLDLMKPVLPIPIAMVGLVPATDAAGWDPAARSVFRGTQTLETLFANWQDLLQGASGDNTGESD